MAYSRGKPGVGPYSDVYGTKGDSIPEPDVSDVEDRAVDLVLGHNTDMEELKVSCYFIFCFPYQ